MEYGILCIVPVVVLLAVAITTRKCISSMVIAILSGCIIIGGTGWLTTFIDGVYTTGCSEDTIWILTLLALIGPVVALLQETGGANVLVEIVEKKVRSERSLFLWSWLLSALLFIEDMMRTSVLGQLTPLYDRFKVPRASVAYFIDATSTTITSLVPITGWAVFFQGIFAGFDELGYLGSGFDIYVKTIPYNFYAIAALIVCFLFTMGVIPKLGGMKKAYQRAEETGELYTEASKRFNPPVEATAAMEEGGRSKKARLACFALGIVTLTVSIILTDVLTGFVIGLFAMVIICFVTKMASWKRIMEAAMEGETRVIEMIVICFCVYFFKNIITDLQLPEYVIEICGPLLSASMFPFVTFAACCLLTFTSGSTWGVTVVYATIAVPLCMTINADPVIVLAAILSGEAFGAHICFYCDYTVFASTLSKIDNMEHAFTQVPYGLIGGGLAGIAFLITGIFVM